VGPHEFHGKTAGGIARALAGGVLSQLAFEVDRAADVVVPSAQRRR
jgi:hypothetical protein